MEMNKEYASKGVAGAALGTGTAGLALGVINSLGGMAGLAGLFGGNGRSTAAQNDVLTAMLTAGMINGRSGVPCGSDCDPVTQREMRLVQEIAAKDSQIALRDANTYGDQKMLELYKYIDGKFIEFEKQFGEQAVKNQATKDSFQLLQERMECIHKQMEAAIKAEAKERRCNDNTIVNYVNATFYPKMVANVTTGDTTTAQSTYNPLPVCDCDC
ncbi:MAG: hypothetical protein HDT20_04270 [Oscillibacter sp.]|nr:hypothetical protein [Oscillibacter sp.]